VARVPLKVELFDGQLAAGPVPTLFASDQNEAFEGLMANASETLLDVHKLNSRFLFMEHLTMEEAVLYLQGPAKKAKGAQAFPPPPQPPSNKKRKMDAAPDVSTGTCKIFSSNMIDYVISR